MWIFCETEGSDWAQRQTEDSVSRYILEHTALTGASEECGTAANDWCQPSFLGSIQRHREDSLRQMDNSMWLAETQWWGFWLSFCPHLWLAVECAMNVSVFYSLFDMFMIKCGCIFLTEVCKSFLNGGRKESSAIDKNTDACPHTSLSTCASWSAFSQDQFTHR